MLLKVENVELGLGRIEELRDLIGEVRARGKRVVAYVTSASTRELYLASACDKVVMHPAGGLTFAGVAQAVTFYKGAMDRLGVSVELVRIAEFKGAMEPYIMTGQSAPVRENRNQLLDDVYARILDGIATGRASSWAPPAVASALQAAHLKDLTNLAAFTPQEAQRVGLIDVVRDQNETEQYVRELLGDRDLDIVDADKAPPRSPRWTPSRIAVVMVDGTITDGPSQALPFDLGGVAGGDTLVEALEECRRNREIRAVVLRVNSPGGLRLLVGCHCAGGGPGAGGRQAGGGINGRRRRIGRVLHLGTHGHHLRRAVDHHRFDRHLRLQAGSQPPAGNVVAERGGPAPRTARRSAGALSPLDVSRSGRSPSARFAICTRCSPPRWPPVGSRAA